jgi:hypothetical protein
MSRVAQAIAGDVQDDSPDPPLESSVASKRLPLSKRSRESLLHSVECLFAVAEHRRRAEYKRPKATAVERFDFGRIHAAFPSHRYKTIAETRFFRRYEVVGGPGPPEGHLRTLAHAMFES